MPAQNESTLRRFIDSGGDAVDARIATLLRSVEDPTPLAPAELVRVRARLAARRASGTRPLRYVTLLATGMLAGTGFAVAAYGVGRLVDPPRATSATSQPAPAPSPRSPAVPPAIQTPEAATPAADEPLSRSGKPAAASFPEPSSSLLGRESELLARALAKLRRDRDATGALALLDQHARDFPAGALRLEADVARLDALLALGRDSEALALLERLPIDRLGRGTELHVVRAELHARRDPSKALADFDRALATDLPPELGQRALYGRAATRLRLGDETGGRADLETYLARYPNGRFAAEARRRLAP